MRRWAADTWRQPRGDDRPEDRAAGRQHQGVAGRRRTARATPRRPTSAATCGAPSSPASSGIISRRRVHAAPRADAEHTAADEAPRAERHVLQLVRRGERARCITTWPEHGRPRLPVPLQRRQRLARRRPARRALRRPRGRTSWPPGSSTGCAGTCSTTPTPPRRPAGPDPRRLLRRAAARPGASTFTGNHIGVGPDVWYTNHHYDTTVSETRITTYLGILTGQIPATQYFAMWRTFPASCDWSWPEMQPVGETRTYLGLDVYEGAYTYRGMHIVPGWGGSMFEELMPDVFVPEASWAPRSWGVNHRLHVRAQREHGLVEAGYGYWGFSPVQRSRSPATASTASTRSASTPTATSPTRRRPTTTPASATAARRRTPPRPYGDGVVTPHASFLAMMHEPTTGLRQPRRHPGASSSAYGDGGFFDAVAVRSGTIARRYLVPRPGHGHGRHRKRAGGQRDPPRLQHPRCRAARCARSSAWRSSEQGWPDGAATAGRST